MQIKNGHCAAIYWATTIATLIFIRLILKLTVPIDFHEKKKLIMNTVLFLGLIENSLLMPEVKHAD
jgi:hypothetical protein